jgi:hypothetical protein
VKARKAAAAARLLTWRTGYGDVAPPEKFPDGAVACEAPLQKQHPDAWRLGPRAALSDGLLIAGAQQVLIDIDGDTKGGDVAALVRERAFDAEVALHFGKNYRTAFYDTDNDGTFDLVLVDNDADPEADVRYVRGKEERNITAHWLSASYLGGEAMREKAVARFRTLRAP